MFSAGKSSGLSAHKGESATAPMKPKHKPMMGEHDGMGAGPKSLTIHKHPEGGFMSEQDDGDVHDHENLDALKQHLDEFFDEEGHEKGDEGGDEDEMPTHHMGFGS